MGGRRLWAKGRRGREGWHEVKCGERAGGSKVAESQPGKVTVPARARSTPHRRSSHPISP